MTQPAVPHVLVTADSVGGVWTYAADLASGLIRAGIDVTLAVLGPAPTPAQREMVAPSVAVIETGWALDWLADDAEMLSATGAGLAGLAARIGADLVHLNSPLFAAVARFDVAVVGACHSCLATWWDDVKGGEMPATFRWRTDLLAAGYAACDALIAPSCAFAAATSARYGVRPRVVQNGRSPGARAYLPSCKQPFVLTAGRLWDDGKNVVALDAAAARMHGRVRAAGLMRSAENASPACDALDLLGALGDNELSATMNHASVFASLALYEPFGLSVLEAAQSGCALVLSDIPTFRELWSDAAIFVDPDDIPGTAATLDGLLDDAAEAARYGGLAAERSRQYSASAMVRNTLLVYRDLGVTPVIHREAMA